MQFILGPRQVARQVVTNSVIRRSIRNRRKADKQPMPALENVRQERFALALVKGLPASRAYELAGYEANDSNAARLNGFERVKERVSELMSETKASATLTRERLTQMMIEDRALAREKGQAAAAIRASELLGMQYADMYRKRSDVNVTNDVAAMSDADLRVELAKQLRAAGLIELADSVASAEPAELAPTD